MSLTPIVEAPPAPAARPKIVLNRPNAEPRGLENRPASNSSGPSIDTILKRTRPGQSSLGERVNSGMADYFSSLEQSEEELHRKQRELARLQAETDEKQRVVRETEILLNAREKLLQNREELLSSRTYSAEPAKQVIVLEKSLENARMALDEANDALGEKEGLIAQLREEIEELSRQEKHQQTPDPEGVLNGFDGVNHPSLAEQVAFLQEREAFIEESENTLFEKAQRLQEWEARLSQQDDELKIQNSGQNELSA